MVPMQDGTGMEICSADWAYENRYLLMEYGYYNHVAP